MFDSVVKALTIALTLWDDKEKTKYQDSLMRLQRDYRDEDNKPDGERDNAVLDNLEFELCILIDSLASVTGTKKA